MEIDRDQLVTELQSHSSVKQDSSSQYSSKRTTKDYRVDLSAFNIRFLLKLNDHAIELHNINEEADGWNGDVVEGLIKLKVHVVNSEVEFNIVTLLLTDTWREVWFVVYKQVH